MNAKFRVWDKHRNQWINDCDLLMDSSGQVFAGDLNNPPMVPIDSKYVSFFTGLKDKSGKEIYEGDIVKGKAYEFRDCPRIIGEVIYDYCEFKVESRRDKTSKMKAELNKIYEVIGNIYENQELL